MSGAIWWTRHCCTEALYSTAGRPCSKYNPLSGDQRGEWRGKWLGRLAPNAAVVSEAPEAVRGQI